MLTKELEQKLMATAIEYRKRSHSPYSGFCVGAALLAKNGTIFGGCNIENAAYSVANCAERTALFKAVSEGVTEFEAIAIVGGKADGPLEFCSPCGVCRQALVEFCNPKEFMVLLGTSEEDYKGYSLEELLPYSFTPKNLL
ncbi:MAG: cytidine deaminase [Lachnospiraceae bacterium]|nr:cytidine deaminase [Lachnospiraceae bacterium]